VRDQRGPWFRALAESLGERRCWRYEHPEDDESRGTWWFEAVLDEHGEWWCVRMVAPTFGLESAYDWEHIEDEHGFLPDQPIDPTEPLLQPVSVATFESAWRRVRL